MVLLSDGEPTYSYEIKNPDNYLTKYHVKKDNDKVTKDDIPETEYMYNQPFGDGTKLCTRYDIWLPCQNKYYHHGNSAIAESRFAKKDGIDRLYTIGLQTSEKGREILESIATPNDFHKVKSVDELGDVFKTIGASIVKATKEAKVDVQFKDEFMLPEGIEPEDIKHSPGSNISINEDTGCPKWEIGSVETPFDAINHPEIKCEWISFDITVNDRVLKSKDNSLDPFENMSFEYKDKNGKSQSKSFPHKIGRASCRERV